MDELDPIRQLQHLLNNPGKLLEKISRIQSALGSIRAPDSIPAEESAAPTFAADETRPTPKAPTQRYSQALHTLRNMQAQLEERVVPLARAAAQAEGEQLRERARQGQITMNECLAQLDRRILACLDRFYDAQRKYADLTLLNQRLVSLGSAAEPLPDGAPLEDATLIIETRLDALRQQGKV